MSDFLKNNPLMQQVLFLVLLTIFAFAIGKPYIDKGDERNYEYVMEEMVPRLDTLIDTNSKINELLKKGL